MTKDRRLGRGLAALLGTPLEEDGVLEPTSPATGASQPRSASATQTSSGAGKAARVTGAVPLFSGTAGRPRGLPAQSTDPHPSPEVPAAQEGLLEINVSEIDNNPFQPRRKFNEEEIASLAESIREHQQLQPILVRRVAERFQLISGERRLRATLHAGLKTIRAVVREADDRLVAELAIVENLQRKDLDAIEKAMSFRRYIDQHQCTQEDLAQRLKIDRSTIANLMRLLELPPMIQQWIQSDKITAGHARALLPLGEEEQQLEFAQRIKEEAWSVRETESRVTQQLAQEDGTSVAGAERNSASSRKRVNPQIASLEQKLRLALGTKAEIRLGARGRGKIVVSFANADEFDRLFALICPSSNASRAA